MKLRSISEKLHQTTLGQMYDLHHEQGQGRALILIHSILSSTSTTLVSGAFYTSFLTIYGIDIVSVGILTFVPYIAMLLSLIAPYILERMQQRRWFLAVCRSLYYLFYILGVTLLPELVTDPQARLPWLVGLIFAANIFNALSTQGYTAWHAQYLPSLHRFSYFFSHSLSGNVLSCSLAILLSVLADATADTSIANAVIIGIRYIALGIGMLDVLVLTLVKEHPYPRREQKIKLSDVFTLPVKNRKFLHTMEVCFGYTFAANLCAGVFMYYLLNDAQAPYSLSYFIDLGYSLFLVLFRGYWNRRLDKWGWIKVFNIGNLLQAVSLAFIALVDRHNVLWLYTLMRMFQHFYGVGYNNAYSNFLYMNTPKEGQTNYITFYTVGQSLFTFLGISFGTWFVGAVGSGSLRLLGHNFTAVPLLVLIQSGLFVLLYLFTRITDPRIDPNK